MTMVRRLVLPDGDAGTAITVAHIAALIRDAVSLTVVRQAAGPIVRGCAPGDWPAQMLAIRAWLTQVTAFVRDPIDVELVQAPDYQLQQIAEHGVSYGDCDDVAVLGGAIGGALGFQVSLITVAFLDNAAPLSHIWASISPPVAFLNGAGKQVWMELDTTRPMQNIPMHAISRSVTTPVL